jgi:hypothetical protein
MHEVSSKQVANNIACYAIPGRQIAPLLGTIAYYHYLLAD